MKVEQGNRRVVVVTEILAALIGLAALVLVAKPEQIPVFLSLVGVVGTLIIAYFGADGYIKGKMTPKTSVPEQTNGNTGPAS